MILAEVIQFDLLSSELQCHSIGKGNVRHRRWASFTENHCLGSFMRDNHRRVRENFTTGNMVRVVVAVDKIPDRLCETLCQFFFEPARGIGIDGVGSDDTGGRHKKHGKMPGVAKAVQISSNLGDLALGLLLGREHGQRHRE